MNVAVVLLCILDCGANAVLCRGVVNPRLPRAAPVLVRPISPEDCAALERGPDPPSRRDRTHRG